MRLGVLGGGPGGLFFATLAKRSQPGREVHVFERHEPARTFGFGVVFSDRTLAGLEAVDPGLHEAMVAEGTHWEQIEVRLRGERYGCGGNGMGALRRSTLLGLLQRSATEAGVVLHSGRTVRPEDVLEDGFDLVVGADGTHSALRGRFASAFGAEVATARARFVWLGTTCPFPGLTFLHEQDPAGVFAVHAYPVGGGLSTFIVETDEAAWEAAGLDQDGVEDGEGALPRTLPFLEHLFAEHLGGHRLLVNRSRWSSFVTRRAARWWVVAGRVPVVLLGDAAHTAHFSVGSGTKMAMEDAVALVEALDQHPGDLEAALRAYEAVRRPEVERIQAAARPSLAWWEHFGRAYRALPPWQFAYHFFTRSLPESRLRRRDSGFVDATHARWRAVHGARPLASSLRLGDRRVPGRLVEVRGDAVVLPDGLLPLRDRPAPGRGPWGLVLDAPSGEEGLGEAQAVLAKGVAEHPVLVAVRGGTPLTRRLLGEAARLEEGSTTLVVEEAEGPELEDLAVTAVLSGRCDLVGVPEGAQR
jgi:2-polyprenyl-6-methoxyphenol hydroxylase-like FAD-dependent oxidoreductase